MDASTCDDNKAVGGLNILFVSAEVSPFAKVGGLADVAGSLPRALIESGHKVRVVMPAYAMVLDNPAYQVECIAEEVPVYVNGHWPEPAKVYRATHHNLEVFLIGSERWFTGTHHSEQIYLPGIEQYLWFSAATLQVSKALGWKVDVIHCHDWHTGLIPVLMREKYRAEWDSVGAVMTIHNFAYQGEFGFEILDWVELPHHLWQPHLLETYGSLNFLKSGCVYADQVTTVSPTYAHEIQTPEYGCRLEGLMQHLAQQGRLTGILNGIDETEFDPATDPYLAKSYDARDPKGKAECRKALLEVTGLKDDPSQPICGMVSRLSSQKGMDLVLAAARQLLEMPCQLAVLGSGDPFIAEQFRSLAAAFPDQVFFREGFEIELAPQIYAGSDLFFMPSKFEPCGLGQLIAMRYGTVPLVRLTGGLKDTVTDGTNGFTFGKATVHDFAEAIDRACRTFRTKKDWDKLVASCMAERHGWSDQASAYREVYRRSLNQRRAEAS